MPAASVGFNVRSTVVTSCYMVALTTVQSGGVLWKVAIERMEVKV